MCLRRVGAAAVEVSLTSSPPRFPQGRGPHLSVSWGGHGECVCVCVCACPHGGDAPMLVPKAGWPSCALACSLCPCTWAHFGNPGMARGGVPVILHWGDDGPSTQSCSVHLS